MEILNLWAVKVYIWLLQKKGLLYYLVHQILNCIMSTITWFKRSNPLIPHRYCTIQNTNLEKVDDWFENSEYQPTILAAFAGILP